MENIWKTQTIRNGRTVTLNVELKNRIDTLEYLMLKNLNDFTFESYVSKKIRFDRVSVAREREQLNRLAKNGWLKKYTNEDGKLSFKVTKKAILYSHEWGSFYNPVAPLMKNRSTERQIIEKEVIEVPVEVHTREHDRIIGER